MTYTLLTTKREGPIEYLTLNRPEVRNAFNEQMIAELTQWATSLAAVGHRVVHGGTGHDGPCVIDAATVAELDALCPLAPLQQPHNIAAIRAVTRAAPELTQIACFETAFHSKQPAVAQTYGLPRRYIQEGVRAYGFHGLSYEYVAWLLSSGRFPATARRGCSRVSRSRPSFTPMPDRTASTRSLLPARLPNRSIRRC